MQQKSFALIGPGRVGTALTYLLGQEGYVLKTVVGRSNQSLEQAEYWLRRSSRSAALPPPVFTQNLEDLPTEVDFLLLGVKDSQIAGVVSAIQTAKRLAPEQVLIHLSGVMPADTGLAPGLPAPGQLALHPLQAVADVQAGIAGLCRAVWTLEGNEAGVALGAELLTALRIRWCTIERQDKPLYHAAACVVSNYLVTLAATGIEMLTKIGFTAELAQEALLPLIQGTVANLTEKSPREALTGPIARGDALTVAQHLTAIAHEPAWCNLYREAGLATLQYASLSDEFREAIRKLLVKEESA